MASMTLQVMELGEPDASGRRSPKAVEGCTEELEVDMVILAIGQAVNPEGLPVWNLPERTALSMIRIPS